MRKLTEITNCSMHSMSRVGFFSRRFYHSTFDFAKVQRSLNKHANAQVTEDPRLGFTLRAVHLTMNGKDIVLLGEQHIATKNEQKCGVEIIKMFDTVGFEGFGYSNWDNFIYGSDRPQETPSEHAKFYNAKLDETYGDALNAYSPRAIAAKRLKCSENSKQTIVPLEANLKINSLVSAKFLCALTQIIPMSINVMCGSVAAYHMIKNDSTDFDALFMLKESLLYGCGFSSMYLYRPLRKACLALAVTDKVNHQRNEEFTKTLLNSVDDHKSKNVLGLMGDYHVNDVAKKLQLAGAKIDENFYPDKYKIDKRCTGDKDNYSEYAEFARNELTPGIAP